MKIIGITGPTGAGKSLVSEYLARRGLPVIDADEVYHRLLIPPSPCLDALRAAFGDGVFHEDGSLDRPALSEIVFHDKEKLGLLNHTVLDMVLEEIRSRIRVLETMGETVVAVDAPTLIESGFHRECDTVLSVLAPEALRRYRIMERDHLSPERAWERIHGQQPDDFYREHSQHVLINDGDQAALEARVASLLLELS